MKTNSALTGSYTKNPFCYQQIDLKGIRILRRGQPIVHYDAVDAGPLYVTTNEVMIFEDDIPCIPIDNSKDDHVMVLDLISIKVPNEHSNYPKLVGRTLRPGINFTSPLEPVTELIFFGERISSVSVDKVIIVGKNV